MQQPNLKSRRAAHWLSLGPILFAGVVLSEAAVMAQTVGGLIRSPFFVRSYGGKCLDFGAPPQVTGSPVFIYDCNGTIAQQVSIEEVDDRHQVILRAGDRVIGVKEDLVNGLPTATPIPGVSSDAEEPLELQNDSSRTKVLSRTQVFALDGDSIMLAADRNRVVQVQNNRGANRTPLVLGGRDLDDSEFWTFTAANGIPGKLTNGFVSVPQEKDFVSAVSDAHWNTVIQVDGGVNLKNLPPLEIPAGVTIRGDRRNTNLGPQLWAPNDRDQCGGNDNNCGGMLEINGDSVRITGLRIEGPTRSLDTNLVVNFGIVAHDQYNSIIDHNDLSNWTEAAVNVVGDGPEAKDDKSLDPRYARPQRVRITRNFIPS
jgi:hypothetical protein